MVFKKSIYSPTKLPSNFSSIIFELISGKKQTLFFLSEMIKISEECMEEAVNLALQIKYKLLGTKFAVIHLFILQKKGKGSSPNKIFVRLFFFLDIAFPLISC